MALQEYLEKMKDIHAQIILYLDYEVNDEENYENLFQLLVDQKIRNDSHELKLFLHLILKIANNHHHTTDFFDKIEKILHIFKNEIPSYLSNLEIFTIFKTNKRILLFLIYEI